MNNSNAHKFHKILIQAKCYIERTILSYSYISCTLQNYNEMHCFAPFSFFFICKPLIYMVLFFVLKTLIRDIEKYESAKYPSVIDDKNIKDMKNVQS